MTPFSFTPTPANKSPTSTVNPRTNGKTASQIGAEVVERRTREEGRNPGTLSGISRRADVAIPRFSLDKLAPKESTPDAMARRGKLVRAAI